MQSTLRSFHSLRGTRLRRAPCKGVRFIPVMNTNRDHLKVQYKNLYSELQSILFAHDLMEINFETNTDEYDPEIDTILPRLGATKNSEDVSKIIFEEFEN